MGFTKAILSGSLLEIYEFQKRLPEKRPGRKKPQRNPFRRNPQRRHDNIQRSRKLIRRIIRANLIGKENPAFITLTMYQDVSIPTSWTAFSAFTARLRVLYGKRIKYCAVLELQERGAPHFHILIWGINQDHVIREFSRSSRFLQHQWLRGSLDILPTNGSPALAGYLTKYVSKQMHDPRFSGQKNYVCSRNMLRPLQTSGNTLPYDPELIPVDKPLAHSHEFDTIWLGRATYKSYEL